MEMKVCFIAFTLHLDIKGNFKKYILWELTLFLLDRNEFPGSGSQLPPIPVDLRLDLTSSLDVTCFTSMVAVWR